MSNQALQETVIAQTQIISALIAAVRKKDALDLTLFNQLIETMRERNPVEESGKNKVYNDVIEAAKTACLIRDHQPKAHR